MSRILSIAMSIVLMLTGCGVGQPGGRDPFVTGGSSDGSSGGNAGGSAAVPASFALAQPVYPVFPKQPQFPEDGSESAWDAYMDDYQKYADALAAIRGEGVQEADRKLMTAFAEKSVPVTLAGRDGQNTVFSPLSLWSALAMLAQCAEGDSRQQALDAVGAGSVEELQASVSRIWKALYTDDGANSLTLANSIWLNSGMEGAYVQETLDLLAQKYFAGAYSVPMGASEADQAVTEWVKEQTHGHIGGGDPVVQTTPDTLALLASSLYYRAGWTDKFSKERTDKDIFTNAAGQQSEADFMHMDRQDAFLRRENYQAASLEAALGEMIFVLPDEGTSPEALLRDPDFLGSLELRGGDSHYGEVQWSVPKFDVDSQLGLLDALSALGITDLLDRDKADLSALTSLRAFVSDAKQLARVKVDEEGVEAAAVTILSMEATSAMPEEDPEVCVMDLDRPFLFVIRCAGIPLFVGVVNQV